MRHGHALSAREAKVPSDSERPLSPLGEKEALEASLHLKGSGFVPDLIISSPFIRAGRTAAIASGVFPKAARQTDHALSDGPAQALLDLILELSPDIRRVLIVGHQPLIGAISGFLLGRDSFDLSPAGFVRLELSGDPGSGSLVECYAPSVTEGKSR
jgi:phosphohistidine phosphatase